LCAATRIHQLRHLSDPSRITLYGFKAKHRIYLVTIEEYSFGVHAIKYCGMRDRNNKKAYKIIYNDQDSIRVISTCLRIILKLWRNNPEISFAFYAVPKPIGYRNERARYDIFENAMVNLFPTYAFKHYHDKRNSIYVLLNNAMKRKKNAIEIIGKFLLSEYEMIFEPTAVRHVKRRK
jgi:hypothetical protein